MTFFLLERLHRLIPSKDSITSMYLVPVLTITKQIEVVDKITFDDIDVT